MAAPAGAVAPAGPEAICSCLNLDFRPLAGPRQPGPRRAANADLIGVIVFAIFFGIALSAVDSKASKRLGEVLQGLSR